MPLKFHDCSYPWTTMCLYPDNNGCFAPCCHFYPPDFTFPFIFSKNCSIAEAWNSTDIIKLRESIAENSIKFERCINCVTLSTENDFGINPEVAASDQNFLMPLSMSQQENLISTAKHFYSRDSKITSVPISYLIRFGYKCNLRCIMCNHESYDNEKSPGELDFNWFEKELDTLKKAYIIAVTGGEPFFMDSSRSFISWFLKKEELRSVQLEICTNAMLLKPFIPQFKNYKVGLDISLDSYGKYYELIRKGASWSIVSDNIDEFLLSQAGSIPNQQLVKIHCTITRTGLPGLPDLVNWAMDRGIGMNFVLMENWIYEATFQNLHQTPAYLLEIPNWEKYFDDAILRLEKDSPDKYAAEQLLILKNTIIDSCKTHINLIDNQKRIDIINEKKKLEINASLGKKVAMLLIKIVKCLLPYVFVRIIQKYQVKILQKRG